MRDYREYLRNRITEYRGMADAAQDEELKAIIELDITEMEYDLAVAEFQSKGGIK